jgi:cyclic beta-1,2-glucan synthetase
MSTDILKEFKKNVNCITEYYKKLIIRTKKNLIVGTINEWIIDNYYVISQLEKDIKNEYLSKELKMIRPSRKRHLYTLTHNYLSENDLNINMTSLFEALNEYQEQNHDYFTYYEINFICLLLKIILINELSSLVKRLDKALKEKDLVEKIFSTIQNDLDSGESFDLEKYIEINDDIINRPYYIEQLNYKLKNLGQLAEEAFVKLNDMLLKHNILLKDAIQKSHSDLTRDNLLMINIFGSLKKITKYKLEYIYKNISYAEKALISEETNIYNQMYDNNKIDYRLKIINNSKRLKMSEYEYTKMIVEQANNDKKHVGWYLFKPKNYQLRTILYISTIVIFTILLSALTAKYMGDIVLFFISLVPMSVVAIEILNQLLMHLVRPSTLFKLKFEEGLPVEYSTMVVIPTIVKDKNKINDMFERLEVYYLSNKTDNIYFTLLGDCSSADTKHTDKDQEIVQAGLNKVSELNEKYGKKLFYFVYRNRFYNKGEGEYLGYERKRGALLHFNQLLLGKLSKEQQKEYFKCHTFEGFAIPIKYVITLDTDTKLVLNTALKLIGAMAHPMNRPVLSEDGRKVISGYAIMQPRVGIDVEVTNKSIYSQLFAGLGGLDVYITACFDLYQDIFNEGSFVGKGIYDLKIFDQVLRETFPENLILSHDLIEGNYLRCGFINDVELFDDYPARYLNDAVRHHRWNRGDWQIISWLGKKVRNTKGEIVRNPISTLGKWKIFDNLRRSLVSISLLLFLLYGFLLGPLPAFFYFLVVSFIIAIPIFFYLISRIIYRQKYDPFLRYYLNLIRGIIAVVNKSFIVLAVLPYEAKLYVDSIIRALYRMYISKKNLLNWITAEEVEKVLKNDLKTYLRNFKINYLLAIILLVYCLMYKIDNIFVTLVIFLTWIGAPFLLFIISKDIGYEESGLDEKRKQQIKDIAIKTWKYFDELITEENNYLIPDNYQLNRAKKIDYKTSPTDIGFSLISIISAVELELIGSNKALTMIANIIKTVEELEKWHGHLYNWYNINTLNKLYPYFVSTVDNGNFVASLYVVKSFLEKYGERDILHRVVKLIDEIDFSKLYNQDLEVFSIGYNGSEQVLSTYHYNNFASEARLASFIAIAKGEVPFRHWFCLDKSLTKYKHYKGVASWSGTAFEYFMPLIFIKTFKHTLLDETYYFAYYAQREFMREIDPNLPWGLSESAYNELDDSGNYKYSAFGVPYLKFQNNISYPIVISPYSSLMAISVDDEEVYNNIKKLKKLNMYGEYGFYEAYDYEDKSVIKNYYAHHQGMILTSLTNYLKDNVIQEYFHTNEDINSIEMLLKEKVQIKTYIDLKIAKYKRHQYPKERQELDFREYTQLGVIPEMGVLSNGSYTVLINDRGIGFSKYNNLQINRYRQIADEAYGVFFYIRNLNTNKLWSNTYAPLNTKNDQYKVTFASDRIKFVREDEGIATTTEITVVKDHNAEIRKLTFQNNTNDDVILEVTSFAELIMCRNEVDIDHRAFNSLTISSEVDEETSSLIFRRRSRTKENTDYYIINRLFLDKDNKYPFEFETSRLNFIGRHRNVNNPEIIMSQKDLTKTIGSSLDPIMSIRKQIRVKAKDKTSLYFLIGFGKSKEQVLEIIKTYKDGFSIANAFDITTVFSNMITSYANLTAAKKRLYNSILKYIYQPLSINDERNLLLANNQLGQSGLWKFGISGDWPIIVAEIDKIEEAGYIRDVLQLYEFYKSRGIYIDVCIINNENAKKEKLIANYINSLMYRINNLNYFENSPGNVYTISAADMTEEEKDLLKIAARLYLNASRFKSLEENINYIAENVTQISNSVTVKKNIFNMPTELPKDIEFYNNYGGFINQGREYLISDLNTPTPWINILVNDHFGSIITNKLSGFTYAYNSREFKLTSWSNDIVGDPLTEALIINRQLFRPSIVRHGFGYTTGYSTTKDYDMFVKIFVGQEDPLKFYQVNITNKKNSKQAIKLELMLKMVLGTSEELTNRYLYSHFDKNQNRLYFRNAYRDNFKHTVFITATEPIKNVNVKDVNHKTVEVDLELDINETKSLAFILGCDDDNRLLESYQKVAEIENEYQQVVDYWQHKLSNIVVNTPDQAFNYVLNGWYLYQAYVSRLIAKAGFYQVGGAIGFRDQLQDVMGLLYSDPERARNQILMHAAHQFKEGDVLHWWHEQLMFGSRTRFTDDYLWLVYVTYEYLKITEDYSILDELVSFVEGDSLLRGETEKGIKYYYSSTKDTLYNHLKLCINKALNQFGRHGLPLMGSGDWNDGMNKVGALGKGESVFVGFFLYDLLNKMADIAKHYDDETFIKQCLEKRETLGKTLNKNAWDGAWYLRAYFDNGEPLGSRNNIECQIDLLSQAWSILSGVATDDKKQSLIKEVTARLVDQDLKLIKLLTPPFKDAKNNPGYIQDYNVGIRENGAQYTHAALWYIMALLKEGQIDLAYEYYQMINPINRTLTYQEVNKYKTEPYAMAADIYTNPNHPGRGGWTWYTGSASWAYKIGIEEILGFKKMGNKLTIDPKIKSTWDTYTINYRYFNTQYVITVNNIDHISQGKVQIIVDNKPLKDNMIKLVDDSKTHYVVVNMKEDI